MAFFTPTLLLLNLGCVLVDVVVHKQILSDDKYWGRQTLEVEELDTGTCFCASWTESQARTKRSGRRIFRVARTLGSKSTQNSQQYLLLSQLLPHFCRLQEPKTLLNSPNGAAVTESEWVVHEVLPSDARQHQDYLHPEILLSNQPPPFTANLILSSALSVLDIQVQLSLPPFFYHWLISW